MGKFDGKYVMESHQNLAPGIIKLRNIKMGKFDGKYVMESHQNLAPGIIKLRNIKMGKFDGKYVMESHQNLAPCMMALGMTEEMVKKMLDPNNIATISFVENSDGSFTSDTTHSLATEFNHSHTFKIGETLTLKEPFPMTVTVTKKSETVWMTRTEMGGKVMNTETTGNNYGMTLRGTIEGTALSFSEEFKRVSPQVSGFYVFESQKNLEAIMKVMMPTMQWADFEKMSPDMGMRLTERSDGMCVEERFAGHNKTYSVKYDEEYDYSAPDWNVDDKRVTTKTGPGCFTTVCRSKKDGKVSEWSMTFTDCGMSVHIKVGGVEGTEFYKRVADIEGTWRPVAHAGMEGYLRALGITGSMAEDMMNETTSEYFTMQLMAGGKVKTQTNSKWLPSEMVLKAGEAYCFDMPMGKIEGVMTELSGDTFLNVMKFGGKKIAITEKVTGGFMISEYVVDGNKASTMKIIMAKD